MKYVSIVLLVVGAALAQTLLPAPGAQAVAITEPGFFNEPSVAVNPGNPKQMVTAYQINASVAYSRDGGLHWNLAKGTAPSDYRMSGDVSISYDADGRAILCYIAFDKLGTTNYWGHNATRNGIFVRRSPDGGATWESEAHAVISHPTEPGIPFEDKPYIVADVQPRSPYRGNLYVGWTQFTLANSVMLLSRSSDGGITWSSPTKISTHDGLPRDDNGSVEGFTGAVGPEGSLYVVWSEGTDIVFTWSRDGGRTFARARNIVPIAPPYFQVAGVSRANGFPQIGWGPCPAGAHGSRAGILYVTWSDYRNGDVDVFSITSRNGGRSWSHPVRVNTDTVHNGSDQYFQWLAVDPADGAANVVFYDRRGDPENQSAIVVLARSTDQGQTWMNYAWTKEAFAAHEDFLGDYTGLAALNGHVYGAWAEEAALPATPAPKAPGGPAAAPPDTQDHTISAKPRHRTVVRVGVADFSH
jgi:hypothetical protein